MSYGPCGVAGLGQIWTPDPFGPAYTPPVIPDPGGVQAWLDRQPLDVQIEVLDYREGDAWWDRDWGRILEVADAGLGLVVSALDRFTISRAERAARRAGVAGGTPVAMPPYAHPSSFIPSDTPPKTTDTLVQTLTAAAPILAIGAVAYMLARRRRRK